MDAGFLALLIPVLALATGFVAVLKMPREAFLSKRSNLEPPSFISLQEEVAQLRSDVASIQERLEFTERLLLERPGPPSTTALPADAMATRPPGGGPIALPADAPSGASPALDAEAPDSSV